MKKNILSQDKRLVFRHYYVKYAHYKEGVGPDMSRLLSKKMTEAIAYAYKHKGPSLVVLGRYDAWFSSENEKKKRARAANEAIHQEMRKRLSDR